MSSILKALQRLERDRAGGRDHEPALAEELSQELIGDPDAVSLERRRSTAFWIGLAACLELTQAPFIASRLADWLGPILPASPWDMIGPYWQRGVFDPLDLLATLAGGAVAILLLSCFPTEKAHETED